MESSEPIKPQLATYTLTFMDSGNMSDLEFPSHVPAYQVITLLTSVEVHP